MKDSIAAPSGVQIKPKKLAVIENTLRISGVD